MNKVYILIINIGAARGGGEHRERPPPEMEKVVVEKWCYFRRLYFYQQPFQKSFKFNFPIEVLSKIFKTFTNFPNNLCFSSKHAKI